MSRIDELIHALCPNGVAYKTLGEVGNFTRGNGLQKKDLREEGIGAIHYGQVFTHYGTSATATKSFVEPAFAQKLRRASSGDLVIATTSENDEDVCKAVAWLGREEVAVSGDAYIFRHSLSPKYVAYFFQSQHFQVQKTRFISGTKVRRVSGKNLEKIQIPVPPREVQDEIVRVLDTFSALTAELEAELDARRTQYDHYLNDLTSVSGKNGTMKQGWNRARIGDVAQVEKGRTPIQKAIPGEYPLVATARERQSAGKYDFDAEAVCVPLISSKGHGIASISRLYYQSGKFALGTILCAVIPRDPKVLSAEFLYYYLQAWKDVLLVPLMRGGANVSLTVQSLRSVSIHIPPIEQQQRIVETLRKLGSIVDEGAFGLPAEIAARHKQYEYYRDRLLAFDEAAR